MQLERPPVRDAQLSRAQQRQLDRLGHLIARSPHGLVSRRDRDVVRAVHIAEAIAMERLMRAGPGSRWLDLGTGGGLPGLALAVIRPDVTWTLLDASTKKIESVRAFAAELGVENVTALAGRAEALAHRPELRGWYAGVVSRAVAPLAVLTELARGFLADHAALVAVKGSGWAAELADAGTALEILGFIDPQAVEVPATERPTWLVRMRAQGPVPPGFPRRDGVPRAKPLGRPQG